MATKSESNLRKNLFKDHSADVRPVTKNDESVAVRIAVNALRLLEINEDGDYFSMVALVKLSWKDYQLKWDEAKYDNLECINIDPSIVWKPDINLGNYINDDNSEHAGSLKRMNTDMLLCSDGTIYWESSLVLKTMCNIDVRYYPNDYHKCVLHFESHIHTKDKMNLTFIQSEISNMVKDDWYYENLAWDVVQYWAINKVAKYTSFGYQEDFSVVRFYFIFHRKSVFFTDILLFSITLTTALMICAFILPNESGERMGVALTLMLAALVFIVQIAENIPLNAPGGSVPHLAIYFNFCLILKTLMIIALILTRRLFDKTKPMGKWTEQHILENLAYIVKVKSRKVKSRSKGLLKHQVEIDEDYDTELKERNEVNSSVEKGKEKESDESKAQAEKWQIVSKTIDRCLFIFFLIVFVLGGIAICISINVGSKIAYKRMVESIDDFGYDSGYDFGYGFK